MLELPPDESHHGACGVAELPSQDRRPILFLDIDDVLCLNEPFSGFEVLQALRGRGSEPERVIGSAFSPAAVAVLKAAEAAVGPMQYVISSSWRLLMTREEFCRILRAGGLDSVADTLGVGTWATPEIAGGTRYASARDRSLARHASCRPAVPHPRRRSFGRGTRAVPANGRYRAPLRSRRWTPSRHAWRHHCCSSRAHCSLGSRTWLACTKRSVPYTSTTPSMNVPSGWKSGQVARVTHRLT
jgi:hypothetical protein